MEVLQKHSKVAKTIYDKTCVAKWTIADLFTHVTKRTQHLDSEKCELNGLKSKFHLRVCINTGFHYRLIVDDMAGEKPIEIEFKFWLENGKHEKCAETSAKKATFQSNAKSGDFDNVLTYDQLRSIATFFNNGSATVFCEMSYQTSIDGPEPQEIDNDVREKLWNSYQDGLYDGVTIQVKKKQFKVSKMILAANSEVFKRMFMTSSCKEVQTGIINITDANAVIMEAFVEYIHRGKVEILEPVAVGLFKVADKYNVKPLKSICAEAIGKSLNSDSLFEVVVLAYMYNSDHLKQTILDFLLANRGKGYFSQLTMTDDWIDFVVENRELSREIIKDVTGKMGADY